ncbi:methylated-DNA--[protein]-cysteine S-methyltransferase [Calorimonas adulescens]|jgi:O-6-methylguanine DNA methyltransferase|uniref:Methylated-DNA--protein-cysteine methyltransferase n=1 Tax=Calorimonas adulescens TaxID=2606906 RepID=A0A5D8Q974_9THEO|nr:methylated-DNA--[protein]-cysteine S-methyltransferase [Calorimonas adulescens]TZE80927.1 methylated-DNA--[protein]-cysteine S-methyltransferase [Calorimonas adulescens]
MIEFIAFNTNTPVGTVYIASYADMLIRIDTDYDRFLNDLEKKHDSVFERHNGVLDETARQLDLYFNRKLIEFDLPVYLEGTEFCRQVWQELTRIPYGSTVSYGEIAERIERPKAVRAVGRAVGSNPIPFVIPCHRVIGKDGSLVGFGLGLDVKRFLLELESV